MYTLLQSLRKVAILANVSHMTVSRWISNTARKVYKRKKETKSEAVREFLKASLKIDPFASLAGLRQKVQNAFGLQVSKELIRIVIKRLGLTKKKAKFFSRPVNLEEKTMAFISLRERLKGEGRTFVSIDETSFGRHTRDVFGYSPKGELLVVPRSRPRVTTMSALCLVQQGKEGICSKWRARWRS
jgi:transposase